jgi:iron complex transport system substrate-binding protein
MVTIRNRLVLRAMGLCMGAVLSGLLPPAAFAADFEDSAGRALSLSRPVAKVFPAGPPAAIFLYMLAPDLMSGWPRAPRGAERELLAPKYADLPTVGRLTGRGGSANLETVLAIKPDLILDYGSLDSHFKCNAEVFEEGLGGCFEPEAFSRC